jgi:hypothetical protein
MVHNHENIKLDNKLDILNSVNAKLKLPEGILKHQLVENGISTYKFKLQDAPEYNTIINAFKKLSNNQYEIVDLWFNKYDKDGYVKPHNHKPLENNDSKWLAGIYYLIKNKDSGNLVLNKQEIQVKEDDFILFDIEDMHYSLPNKSKERIVFSVNMRRVN